MHRHNLLALFGLCHCGTVLSFSAALESDERKLTRPAVAMLAGYCQGRTYVWTGQRALRTTEIDSIGAVALV